LPIPFAALKGSHRLHRPLLRMPVLAYKFRVAPLGAVGISSLQANLTQRGRHAADFPKREWTRLNSTLYTRRSAAHSGRLSPSTTPRHNSLSNSPQEFSQPVRPIEDWVPAGTRSRRTSCNRAEARRHRHAPGGINIARNERDVWSLSPLVEFGWCVSLSSGPKDTEATVQTPAVQPNQDEPTLGVGERPSPRHIHLRPR
jgi:hypothetical protein